MCALTFARRFRYNIFELPRDGVSAIADQKRWIYGLVVQSVRIFGSFSSGSGMRLSNLDSQRGVCASSRRTKPVELDQIREGITAGLSILGENHRKRRFPI